MRRLRRHAEFVGVLRRHQRVIGPDIVVHYALAPGKAGEEGVLHSRNSQASRLQGRQRSQDVHHSLDHKVGLAVPNSVGHAVVRNKIKRRFRVLARKHESLLPDGCSVILRAKPSAATAEFSRLDGQVSHLFSKIAQRAAHPHSLSHPHSHAAVSSSTARKRV